MSGIEVALAARPDLETQSREVARLLSRPGAFPNEFVTWIVYWLTQNIDISTYQLRGLANTFFKAAPGIATAEATASGVMADMATVGPTLSGLPNGNYLAFWGANMSSTNVDSVGLMGMSPNGATASDEQAAKARSQFPREQVPIIFSRAFDLRANDQNYLQAKYMRATGSNPQFWNRWLCGVQINV